MVSVRDEQQRHIYSDKNMINAMDMSHFVLVQARLIEWEYFFGDQHVPIFERVQNDFASSPCHEIEECS